MSPTAPRLPLLVVLGTVAAGATLAACGGSGTSSKPPAATAADDALAFSKCMREHGIKNFPNPEVAGGNIKLSVRAGAGGIGNVSPHTMEAAQSACKRFQPGAQLNVTPQEKVAREEAALKFAKCMREHGIDIHASSAGGGVQIRIQKSSSASGPNPESPAFQTAQKDCQGLLPSRPSGPGPRGLGSTSSAGSPAAKGEGGLAVGG